MKQSIATYVISYRGVPCRLLLQWLKRKKIEWDFGSPEYGTDLPRNQTIMRFLDEDAPRGKDTLLLLDGDMVPTEDTEPLLQFDEHIEHDHVCWSGYCGHQNTGHHVSTFGIGAARMSVHALRATGPPWLKESYNENGTQRLQCQCAYFAQKATVAGHRPVRRGTIGHQQGGDTGIVLFPDGQHKWPYQLEV